MSLVVSFRSLERLVKVRMRGDEGWCYFPSPKVDEVQQDHNQLDCTSDLSLPRLRARTHPAQLIIIMPSIEQQPLVNILCHAQRRPSETR